MVWTTAPIRISAARNHPRSAAGRALISKLQQYVRLAGDDCLALEMAANSSLRQVDRHDDIVSDGDRPEHVHLIVSGWACRYKTLENGRRQIMAFFVPGDMCDIKAFMLRGIDYSIAAITPVTLAEIPAQTIMEWTHGSSRLANALWWSALAAEATEQEWTVDLGGRTALERLGHLLCDLFIRLQGAGLTRGTSCDMPLTPTELAEATGLSVAQVTRSLRELKTAGLAILRNKKLDIPDRGALERAVHGDASNPRQDDEAECGPGEPYEGPVRLHNDGVRSEAGPTF